jgi:predicted transcriptional regulator
MGERREGRCPFETCPLTLREIVEELEGEVLLGHEKLDMEIKTAFASDLMSDVLAFAKEGCLLLTGLTNAQVIRTAEMLDIAAVLFVRGKRPQREAVELAAKSGIPLLMTPYILFEACGRLYHRGLVGSSRKVQGTIEE